MNIFKSTKTLALISFFAVVACAAIVIWLQQLQLDTVEAQNQPVLTFDISIPQRKYLLFEPIFLTFKLSNQNTVPVKWNGLLMIGPDINLITRSETGTEVRWIGKNKSVDAPIMSTEIMQPSKNKEERNLINDDLAEKLFPRPGRYQLQVEFNYLDFTYDQRQNVTIVSNPITVEINEPQGVNSRAYNYIKNTLEPVRHNDNMDERIKTYKYFVDNFRNSVYWKYKAYELGYLYSGMKDYEKAEEAFFEISDIDFYYSKQVEKHLTELSGKLKRPFPRSKRPLDLSNMPVARPLPAPTVYNGPPPADAPVPRIIPNAHPNKTP